MQGDGDLHDAEIRAEMASGATHMLDEEVTDLPRQLL